MTPRVGIGFDAHPFGGERSLRLGGIELPHPRGLQGHSDGDALLHAIGDAILGAAGLASLGELFSDQDGTLRGVDSTWLLGRVRDLAREHGFTVGNVDAVVIGESPRISPHRGAMRSRIAEILGISLDAVNVRGTSTNRLGFSGREEGLAAMAVVLLEPGDGRRKTGEE